MHWLVQAHRGLATHRRWGNSILQSFMPCHNDVFLVPRHLQRMPQYKPMLLTVHMKSTTIYTWDLFFTLSLPLWLSQGLYSGHSIILHSCIQYSGTLYSDLMYARLCAQPWGCSPQQPQPILPWRICCSNKRDECYSDVSVVNSSLVSGKYSSVSRAY